MFFDNWFDIVRVFIVGILAYAALVLLLRVSGKRTLSKMNAFDLIVTIALGSTLATVLLSKDVALLEGVAAFSLLIGLQYAITWASVRSPWIESLVKAEPSLLFYQGNFLNEALRNQRITKTEILSAVRSQGLPNIESAAAVVLETDGTLTIIQNKDEHEFTSLQGMLRDGEKSFYRRHSSL